jgi:hypothetical protein
MKSIANQYRDLKEGRMSQANFMRNLRMSMPQYVTNVTSFNDAVKILKSKSILTEAALGEDNLLDELESEMENGKSYAEAISIVAAKHGMGEDALATKYPEEAVGNKAYADNYDYADDEYPSDYDTFSDYDDGEFWEGKVKESPKPKADIYGEDPNLDVYADKDIPFQGMTETEEMEISNPEIKVGDIVVPNKGPHEGMKHEVIHVFPDGTFNIKPVGPGLKAKDIKYKLGAARAKMSDVEVLAEAENPSLRSPEGVAELVANKYADKLIALRSDFKKFQDAALNFAGQEMLAGGMNKTAVSNLLSAYGYFEDWAPDFIDALDSELETQSMVSKIEKEKEGGEAIKAQYDMEEAKYPVAGEKGYIKVSDLKKGDILGGSGLEIVSMSTGATTPSGKIEVTVKDPKTGKELTKLWNKSTTVRLKKEDLSEAKKKKEAKPELHPNLIHPQELRMGIKVELEHTDDLDKAKKIALDHLAENPYYYTALKLSGIESPSVFTAKAPVKKAKKEKVELVDKENQMKPVSKKKLKEAKLNIDGEPNAVVKQAMAYVDSNPMLKTISDEIEFQQSGKADEAILKYGYWEELPDEAIAKLKLQFNVEEDLDYDTNTGDMFMYLLTPKAKTGSTDLGASFEKFKSQLEEMIREAVNEMQSDDQEIEDIAMSMDETFDGRDNLADEIAAQQK